MYLFDSDMLKNRYLAEDIFHLRLTAGDDFLAAARPGRFVMLAPAGEALDPLLRRPFGIVRCGENWFEVVIKAVGRGTRRLAGSRAGERISVHGPLGNGWPEIADQRSPLILVAGGIGIAAIASVIFGCQAGEKQVLLYGAAGRSDLVLLDELEAAGKGSLETAVITDDGSSGRKGLVTELLAEKLDEFPASPVFACGPEPMLKGVQKVLQEREAEGWLSLENRMACGFGVCLGCVQETTDGTRAKVCTEGPVLPAGKVVF